MIECKKCGKKFSPEGIKFHMQKAHGDTLGKNTALLELVEIIPELEESDISHYSIKRSGVLKILEYVKQKGGEH